MTEIDIETTISDVKLFIEKLKSDLPEVFAAREANSGKKCTATLDIRTAEH